VTSPPNSDYTQLEQERLARNLLGIIDEVHRGAHRALAPNLLLVRMLHARLFDGVRDHAGRIREPGWGSPHVTFGPHRSAENTNVPRLMADLLEELSKGIRSFEQHSDAPHYEHKAIHLAAWAHAQIIFIHPFEDGNGRCTRMLMDWMLIRLGLRPIPVEAVKQEYIGCLNHYHDTDEIQPLVDLLIRLYPSAPAPAPAAASEPTDVRKE
jgi:Fic family protein